MGLQTPIPMFVIYDVRRKEVVRLNTVQAASGFTNVLLGFDPDCLVFCTPDRKLAEKALNSGEVPGWKFRLSLSIDPNDCIVKELSPT